MNTGTAFNRILTAVAALTLSACATCQRHPVACSVSAAVLVGSVIASTSHHGSNAKTPRGDCSRDPLNCK